MSITAKAESRKSQSLKVGTVCCKSQKSSWPCVARNISESGALIMSTNAAAIPDQFNLVIDLDGLHADCEVVWRSGLDLGIKFTGPVTYKTPVSPPENKTVQSPVPDLPSDNTSPASQGSSNSRSIESKLKRHLNRSEQKPLHILVAEDDPDDRYFLSEAFEECDVPSKIQFAENGADALRYLFALDEFENRVRPDLIVLDLNMPKIDGRTALSEIKSYEETRRIPVVVLTTSSFDDDIISTYDLGVSSYITKPPGVAEFKEIVRDLVSYWSHSAVRNPIVG